MKNWNQRKQKLVRVLAWVLAALLIGSAVFSGVVAIANAEEDPLTRDHCSVRIVQQDEAVYQVDCTIMYTNNTGSTLSGVVFSLYANQLRREEALVAEADELADMYYAGFAPGGIEIGTVTVNGKAASWGMQGTYEEFIRVGCMLAPGETAEFGFTYMLLIPESRGPVGYSANDVRLTGFLPGLTVYTEQGWATNAASSIDMYAWEYPADYDVELSLLSWYEPASAGTCVQGETEGEWHITANNVRGFALALSAAYRTETVESALGTHVTVKTSNRAGMGRAVDAARTMIDFLESYLGACPVSDITIAEASLVNGGMDLSGLILLEKDDFSAPEYAVMYGLARQFIGPCTGSDPVDEPWISTAIPQFLYYRCIEETKGREKMLDALNADCLADLLVTLSSSYHVTDPLTAFNGKTDYNTVIRHRGAIAVYQMREDFGDDVFMRALALYVQTVGSSADDLKACFTQAAGRDSAVIIDDCLALADSYQGIQIDRYE